MNQCRLCGEEKSPLDFSIELNDRTTLNWSYRELIEHHTRISLKTNKLLPQSICEECQIRIEGFAEFTLRLEAVQNSLEAQDDQCETKDSIVQIENNEEHLETLEYEFAESSNSLVAKSDGYSEKFFDKHFPDPASMSLNFLIPEGDELSDGQVSESFLSKLNLQRWSEFLPICDQCSEPAANYIDLKSHYETIHNSQEVSIQCSMCDDSFKQIHCFLYHMGNTHAMEHLKHCCLICDKLFSNLRCLSRHVKSEHEVEHQQIFQCWLCGLFCDSERNLQRHCFSAHSKDPKDFARKRELQEEISIEKVNVSQQAKRIKRPRTEKFIVRIEDQFSSDKECEESESDYDEEHSSDDQVKLVKTRNKKGMKRLSSIKRASSSKKFSQCSLFGPEINTFEKLFADEIKGISTHHLSLHLNILSCFQLPNGEIPDEHISKVSEVRWKDLLVCGICKIHYTSINDMIEHADSKHNTRTKLFGCHCCNGEFTTLCESTLVNHLVERHYYEHLKFCCLVCSKLFYDLQSLLNHYKTHDSKFELLVCLICGWYAKTFDDLKDHKTYHMTAEKSENQILCEKVYEKFKSGTETTTRNYAVAEYEKNPDGSVNDECQSRFSIDWSFGKYQCATCNVSFNNPFELFVHQRLKHPKEVFKKIYSCSLCTDKKEYSNLFTFINHATSKHLDNAKFSCIVCSKVFWNYLALADHYKRVHPTFPCIFCCHCGKIFMNVTVASSHFKALNLLRTPEERKLLKEGKIQEETNHICHVCARNFKSRGTLLNHVKTHEALEPSELLQCHICSKFYKNKYKLAQHMVCHEDLRSWKCKTCQQAFNYKKLLQRHIQAVHENERPFGCTFCEKRFNSKYDLTVHVRLHTGDFPYECPLQECDAKYPAWSNLFKHCQSRHKLDIRSEGYKKLKATQKTQKGNEEYGSD